MNATTKAIPTDRLLGALADRQRRAVLRSLAGHAGETMRVSELCAEVVVEEPTPAGPDGGSFERTMTMLCHVHLPKLSAVGLVDYDRRQSAIRYAHVPGVERLLELLAEEFE